MIARRLEWLHCYTRNERWKEEVLLTREELRRLREWHLYKIETAKSASNMANELSNSWIDRSFKAMLKGRVATAQAEYDALPHSVKTGILLAAQSNLGTRVAGA